MLPERRFRFLFGVKQVELRRDQIVRGANAYGRSRRSSEQLRFRLGCPV